MKRSPRPKNPPTRKQKSRSKTYRSRERVYNTQQFYNPQQPMMSPPRRSRSLSPLAIAGGIAGGIGV